ncbi:glycosyltransferase family 4 protein [Psychrobacter sp. 4Bb]|nr:glycosyltransferase family 4 protein [Psychrobacter sp. 4Bb]
MASLNKAGGTERVGSILANSLSEAGYKITLASISRIDNPFYTINKEIELLSLLSFPNSRLCRIPNTIYKIRKLLKEKNVDTLIAVDALCVQFTLPAILGLTVNHVCWENFNFNSYLGSKKRHKTRQLAARYCDAVVTLTEKDKSYWLQGTQHKEQITAIANFCPFPVQEYIKEENTKIVLAVGRLSHIKGFDMLLEAWLQVNVSVQGWTLKIVGEGEDRVKLTNFIKENKLDDSVELVGSTNDVGKYYEQAEIFCLTSRFEGFGMVLTEALAFGLPIISFDCESGPAEVLKGTNSILVPPNDISQLSASLIELMSNDEHRKTISLKNKKKAEEYQPEKIINQWVDLLESFN